MAAPEIWRRRSGGGREISGWRGFPRAGFARLLPGGSGAPPGRHYDRPARSLLNRPAERRAEKRGPELKRRPSAKVAACGAPEGVVSRSQGAPPRAVVRGAIEAPFGAPLPSFARGERGYGAPAPQITGPMSRARRRAQSATVAPGKIVALPSVAPHPHSSYYFSGADAPPWHGNILR